MILLSMTLRKDNVILVLGGSGLIGRAMVRVGESRGYTNLFSPTHEELDATNFHDVAEYMADKRVNHVILAAGSVGGIVDNVERPAELIGINSLIAINCIKAASVSGVKKMLVFGSSCMYPKSAAQPIEESALLSGPVEETSIAYATSKILTVQAALAFNKQFSEGTQFIPIVPNSTYGPFDNFDSRTSHVMGAIIAKMHAAKVHSLPNVKLFGTGDPLREFVYADDVADACFFILESQLGHVGQPINISSGVEISVKDLAIKIKNIVGYQGEVVFNASLPNGVMRKSLSTEKMSQLGWSARTTLDDGIKKTYQWFLAKMQMASVQ